MKIGIYTIHADNNYGAMFQAYGTLKALQKLGHDPELVHLYSLEEEKRNENKLVSPQIKSIITYLYARLNKKVRLKHKRFKEFHTNMKLSKRYYSLDEIHNTPPEYDIHLVGSDQVWNLERGFNNYYFLDFLDEGEKKISFASSFGTSKIDEKHSETLKSMLSSFNAIAVREDDGVNIIKQTTGLVASQVMDPTFLLDTNEWADLATDERIIKEDYIFCYGFDGSEKSNEILKATRQKFGLPLVVVSISLFFPFKVDYFIQEAGPAEFLNLVKNASFVCTSSFHGVAFAIHFRKSFFSTKHPTRNSRMNSLLKPLGLIDRQLEKPKEILKMTNEELYIDYTEIELKIEQAKKDSLKWLEMALLSLNNSND